MKNYSISRARRAIAAEIQKMSCEFDDLRKEGGIAEAFERDDWVEFEVAAALGVNYTMVPWNFCERLAIAVLRAMWIDGPCPACNGTGTTEMARDFFGDDPRTMTVGTVSVCPLCEGRPHALRVDP